MVMIVYDGAIDAHLLVSNFSLVGDNYLLLQRISLIPTRHSIRQTFSELQRLTSREHDETDRQKEWRD